MDLAKINPCLIPAEKLNYLGAEASMSYFYKVEAI